MRACVRACVCVCVCVCVCPSVCRENPDPLSVSVTLVRRAVGSTPRGRPAVYICCLCCLSVSVCRVDSDPLFVCDYAQARCRLYSTWPAGRL